MPGTTASASAILAGEAVVVLTADDKQLNASLTRSENKFRKTMRTLNQVGSSVQQIGGAAIAAGVALTPIITTFIAFDDAALAMKAATETDGAAFEKLRNHALQLGRTTSYTATEVANLMTELGRAGFKPDEIQAMTKATLDLARATGADAVTATKIMSATIRQFGLEAGQATRVADLLAATANKSFTNVTDLGEALKYSATTAADLGLSLEDTLALLGALGNVGIQGSEAGTALKRINVLAATGNKDLQRLFNVDGQDAAGNVRPLVDVLDEITQSTKNLGTAERASKFNEFFGLLGITAASALGKSAIGVKELRDEIDKANGLADTTAKEMDSGLGGGWRKFKGTAEGAAIAIGGILTPALTAAATGLQKVVDRVTTWVSENRQLATRIGAVVVALIALAGVGLGILLIAKGFALAIIAAKALVAVVGLLANPFVWLGILAAVLIAKWFKVSEAGQKLGAELRGMFNGIGETLGVVLDGLIATIQKGDLANAWKIVTLGMEAVWNDLVGGFLAVWHHFTNLFRDAFRDMLAWIKQAWIMTQSWLESKMFVLVEALIIPVLEASDLIGVTKDKATALQGTINERKKKLEEDRNAAVANVDKDLEAAKHATMAEQAKAREDRRKRADDLRNEIREITRVAQIETAVAPMPHEAGRDNLAPMPHTPRVDRLGQLGDAVRGVYQSGDFRGALGMGSSPDVAKDQLKKQGDMVTLLTQIRDKIEPGVFS